MSVGNGIQQVINIVWLSPGFTHCKQKFFDVPGFCIFYMLDGFFLQKAKKIVKLLAIVIDGLWGQFAALAIENKLVFNRG